MTAVAFFFTGFALICALLCFGCVWWCQRAIAICAGHELELRRSINRIATTEHEVGVLGSQIHKLRQKIYSNNALERATEIAPPVSMFPACENWLAAQNEGPASRAAKCECAYCVSQHAARAALRSQLVPKTHAERRDAIKRGA